MVLKPRQQGQCLLGLWGRKRVLPLPASRGAHSPRFMAPPSIYAGPSPHSSLCWYTLCRHPSHVQGPCDDLRSSGTVRLITTLIPSAALVPLC